MNEFITLDFLRIFSRHDFLLEFDFIIFLNLYFKKLELELNNNYLLIRTFYTEMSLRFISSLLRILSRVRIINA